MEDPPPGAGRGGDTIGGGLSNREPESYIIILYVYIYKSAGITEGDQQIEMMSFAGIPTKTPVTCSAIS